MAFREVSLPASNRVLKRTTFLSHRWRILFSRRALLYLNREARTRTAVFHILDGTVVFACVKTTWKPERFHLILSSMPNTCARVLLKYASPAGLHNCGGSGRLDSHGNASQIIFSGLNRYSARKATDSRIAMSSGSSMAALLPNTRRMMTEFEKR